MRRILMCFCLIVISTSMAWAQLPTATILGVVRDSSGAVVAGAKVTAHNKDNDQSRDLVSATDGSYRFNDLPVGNYEVRASRAGFKLDISKGITLTVAQQAVIDFSLEVGSIEQTVEVTTEVPIVDTTSGSMSGVVDEKQMSDIPLNGRNYVQLALLQSGISELKAKASSAANPVLATQGTFFSSNGAPPRSNAYLLDGTSLTTYGGATGASISGSTLGIDGIREFRIVTNSFSAEYGLVMGSQMAMVSKSGSNSFHGTVFEYLRNSALDARNYFDTTASSGTSLSGQPRRLPEFQRNNFGGAVGGPIRKNKTFFFANYEGLRQILGTTNTNGTIPSACRGPAGAVITNTQCPALGTTPSVTIQSTIAPWIPLFPTPNFGANQISFGYPEPTVEDYGQVRVDHTFSAADSAFARYTIDNTTQQLTTAYPGYPTSPESRGQFLTVTESHVFSPSIVNTARFSFSGSTISVGNQQYVTGPQYSFIAGQPMGQITIGGITNTGILTAGGAPSSLGKENVFSYSDDLFDTIGRHSLKFGLLINHYQITATNGTNTYGTITFANLATFLNATPTNYLTISPGFIDTKTVHYDSLGAYAQDDFKVTPRLVLNLGLRYEFNTNLDEIHGYQAALRNLATDAQPTAGLMMTDPSFRNFSPRFGFAWDVFGNGKTAVKGGFGLLYNIAGWAGVIHQAIRMVPYENQLTVTNPASITVPFTIPSATALTARTPSMFDYNMKQSKMLQYNLAVQRQLPFKSALTVAYAGSRGFDLITFVEGNPIIPAGMPGTNTAGMATCVARPAGSVPPNIAQMVMVDGQANSCWLGTETRTNPYWGTFNSLISPRGQSWYNSAQVNLEKAVSRGLQFQSNLTWSRLLDTTQCMSNQDVNISGACMVSDPLHPKLDRAPAAFDIPLTWRFNALYHLPKLTDQRYLGKAINGWWMSGIVQLQSGYPFTPYFSTSRSKSLNGGNIGGVDRPDIKPGRNNGNITRGTTAGCSGVAAGQKLGTQALYFDSCAFTVQPAGFLGNSSRDSLRGPDYKTVDFSLIKDTAVGFLGKEGSIQFRAEVFNILNRANFGLPVVTVFAGNGPATNDTEAVTTGAGQLTTAFPARQVQLALKVLF